MPKYITRRTLLGYRKGEVNMHAFDDLIMQITEKPEKFVEKILKSSFWHKGGAEDMKFNAVVGNPPYQIEIAKKKSESNGQARSKSIFQYFQIISDLITYGSVSLIYPGARWIHRSGKGMEQFGLDQINDPHLNKLIFYPDSREIFNEVSIADGISIVHKIINKKDNKFIYEYNLKNQKTSVIVSSPGDKLIPLNPTDDVILKKVDEFVRKFGLSYMCDRISNQKLFGIESDYIEKNIEKVRPLLDNDSIDYDNEVKLFANNKAGKAGRSMGLLRI